MRAVGLIAALAASLLASPAKAEDIPQPVAAMQGLDKVTGRVVTIEAVVGDTVRFGTLQFVVRVCTKRPPEEPPENTAFIDVAELKPGVPAADIFRGWMFASSPALNAVEHPVYDVWLLECRSQASPAGKRP
jgi:hypothetical protein